MRFDNAQFEKGVATTINTLDKLKTSLNFNTLSTGLSGIASTFTAINSAASRVTFSEMASSLEAIENRFSTMGIVGMQVIQNITNAITGLATKVTSFLTSKIVSGGITRAMNLENAQFQLQGLLNDESKVEAVMQNVNDAVDGTAYSLDSAAKVASQLAASGLEAGDQMFTSLRAVAGVAAMTNSSYDDIGRVFTTVAGQGKVMADQLNQLASRGMNAAATLANYLGVTESEVRTMVSEGKVSFETFASAMDDAFGEHAKEANTTFTGAISNIGAALARIGAKFVSPLIEKGGAAVEMFNSLRLRINEVNASMDPIANAFTTTVNTIAKLVKHYVDVVNFSASIEILTNVVQGLDRRLRFIRVAFYSVFEPFKNAKAEASGLTATILELSKSFNTFSKESKSSYIGETEKIFTAIKNVAEALSIVLGALGDRLNFVLQGFGHATRKLQSINAVGTSFGEVILEISEKLLDLANAINNTKIDQESKAYKIATDIFIALCRAVETLKITFLNIVDVAKIVAEAFSEVFDIKDAETIRYAARMVRNFAKSLTLSDEDSQNLKDTLKGLFTIVKAVWNIFKTAVSVIWPFSDGISGLTSAVLSVTGAIGRLITGESKASDVTGVLKGVFSGLLKVLSAIPKSISVIISKIASLATGVTGIDFSGMFSGIGSFFKTIGSQLGNLDFTGAFGTAASSISNFISAIAEAIKTGFVNLKSGFSAVIQIVGDFVSSVFDSLASLGTNKIDGADKMVKNIEISFNPLTKIGDAIKMVFSKIAAAFSSFGEALTPAYKLIKKIFTSLGKLLVNILNAASSFFEMIKTIFDNFTSFFSGFGNNLETVGNDLGDLLSSIFQEMASHPALTVGEGFLTTILALVKGIISGFGDISKSVTGVTKNLNTFATAIKSWGQDSLADILEKVAASFLILAVSLKVLSTIDEVSLEASVVAITALFAEVVGVLITLQTWQDSLEQDIDLSLLVSSLMKISVSVLLIAIALAKVGEINPKSLKTATKSIAELMGEVVGLMVGMVQFTKNVTDAAVLSSAAKAMLVMAASLLLMVKPIKKLGEMDPTALSQGLNTVEEILGAMGAFTFAIAYIKPDPAMLKGIAVALVSMATAIKSMGKAIKLLGSLDADALGQGLDAMEKILLSLTVAVMGLGIILKDSSAKTIVAAGAAMILIAMAIDTLIPAIAALGYMDGDKVDSALGALALILLEVVGALSLLANFAGKSALAAAASIMIICVALDLLIPVLVTMAAIKTSKLAAICVAIATLIATFVVAAKFSEGMMNFALSLLAIGGGIALLGAGVLMVAEGFAVFVTTIIALAAAWDLIEPVFESMVKALGESIPVLIAGVVAGIKVLLKEIIKTAPLVAKAVWALLEATLDVLFGNLAEIADYFLDLIVEILDILRDHMYEIASILIDMAIIVLGAIEERMQEIVEVITQILMDILIGAIDGVADRVGDLIDSLWKLMIATIDGWTAAIDNNGAELIESLINLATALWNMAKKAFQTIYDLLPAQGKKIVNKIINGITTNGKKIWEKLKGYITDAVDKMEEIWDDLKTIGKNIISGIVEGIEALFDDPISVLGDLGGKIIDVLKDVLGIASPSKETKKIGEYLCQGLTVGLKAASSDVIKSSGKLGEETLSALEKPMSTVADLLGSDFEVDPTIRPVLDLSSVQAGAQQINSLFSQQTMDLATTNSQLSSIRESRSSTKNSDINKLNSNIKTLTDLIQNGNFGISEDAQIVVNSILDGKVVGTAVAPVVDSINGSVATKTRRGYVT
jgi:tape measure domain-containing protein